MDHTRFHTKSPKIYKAINKDYRQGRSKSLYTNNNENPYNWYYSKHFLEQRLRRNYGMFSSKLASKLRANEGLKIISKHRKYSCFTLVGLTERH